MSKAVEGSICRKIMENQLRQCGHAQQRAAEAPVRGTQGLY